MSHKWSILSSVGLGVLGLAALLTALLPTQLEATAQLAPAQLQSVTLDNSQAISQALGYLQTKQLPNGGIEGWTPGVADDFSTVKTVLALAAARYPQQALTSLEAAIPLDYLETRAFSYTRQTSGTLSLTNAGRVGMLVAAGAAGDADPYAFGTYPEGSGSAGLPIDLVEMLQATYNPATGAYSTSLSAASPINQWWAILGLAAVQETVPVSATDYLLSLQEADGGWGYGEWGYGGDPDATSYVLQALLASGNLAPTHPQVLAGLAFLRDQQDEQGGWGYWFGDSYFPSPDSTAAVIQALAAAGYVPATESWAVSEGVHPQAALAAMQAPDGSFGGNALGTAHAIAGLAQAPLPVLGRQGMARRALTWLAEGQNADGGFGESGSSASASAEVVFAFAAAGVDVNTVRSVQGNTPLDFLATQVPTYSRDGGEVGYLVLAAVAGQQNPRDFYGYNLVVSLTGYISPSGQLNTNINFRQALGLLALSAADEPIPPESVQWLEDQQLPSGGWEWAADSGWGADTDTTAMASQALVAAGQAPTATAVVSALNYLRGAQNDDAGFPSSFDPVSNANTTAYVVQALVAAGQDLNEWSQGGRTPLQALRAFLKPDGPAVYQWGGYFGPVDNLMATYQVVPALLGKAHPVHSLPADFFDSNHAGLVIDYGNGDLETVCVPFDEPSLTGLELLDRSGIPYEEADGLVSKIGDVGCPAGNPWCVPNHYWSYWYLDAEGAWQPHPSGAGGSQIVDGSLDGWHWVDWNVWPSPPPGLTPTLASACGPFEPFQPVYRGPDPDRLVAAPPRPAWGSSVDVIVPLGSDLNGDGALVLDWRVAGETAWTRVADEAVQRGDGYFSASLPLTRPLAYEFQAAFSDPDGVQFGSGVSGTVMLPPVTLEPFYVYLPVVVRE